MCLALVAGAHSLCAGSQLNAPPKLRCYEQWTLVRGGATARAEVIEMLFGTLWGPVSSSSSFVSHPGGKPFVPRSALAMMYFHTTDSEQQGPLILG